MGGQPGRVLDRDHALVGRLVRERRPVHEVADRVDAVDARAHRAVDLESAVVELDARRVEAERLDVGRAAGRDHEPVDLGGSAMGEAHGRIRPWTASTACRVDVDALALEAALDDLGDVGVLGRQHAVERLEQQHLVPRRAYAEAISAPEAPAPTTARLRGSSSSAHASSVPITRPPNWRPGSAA